jgi:hypothetical protein
MSKLTRTLKAIKKDNKAKTDKFKKMQLEVSELQNQVRELKNQINRLKSVDIRIEEKKKKNGNQ